MPAGKDPSVAMAQVCEPSRRVAAWQVRELASREVAQDGCGGPRPGEGMLSGSEGNEQAQEIGCSDEIPKGLFLWHTETSTIGGEDPRACSSCGYSEFTSFPPSLFSKAEGTP